MRVGSLCVFSDVQSLSVDLESLLVDLGSLLGVSFGSLGGMLQAATGNLKISTLLQPRPF